MGATSVPKGAGDAQEAFADAYLRRLDAGAGHEPDPAEIASAFAFADGRGSAPIAVRAFTPTRERDGYEPGVSVLETSTVDMPFLVDSVAAEVRARGFGVRRDVHPIVGVTRGSDGRITRVGRPGEGGAESVMHFELDGHLAPDALAGLEDGVRGVLGDVARVVESFDAMRDRVERAKELARDASARYGGEDVEDAIAFLDWLAAEHFVFLGYREYEIRDGSWRAVEGTGLGLLSSDRSSRYAGEGRPLDEMSENLRRRATDGPLVVLSRTNRASPVRRRERMDYVGVRRVNDAGEITGEARFVGLYASRAHGETASRIPLLSRKLERILGSEDLFPGSHDYKAAVRLYDTLPKDEVFAAPIDDLRAEITTLLALSGDQVRLIGRRGPDGRTATLIAALPRRRYDARLRRRLREAVRHRFGTDAIETHEVFSDDDRVQYHLTVHDPDAELPDVPLDALQEELERLARTWEDAVTDRLREEHGDERGEVLAARWLERFPSAYRAITAPPAAAADVAGFDALLASGDSFGVGLTDDGARTRIAFFRRGAKVELSQATLLLEDLGLRVIEELPAQLDTAEETWVQAFGVLGPEDRPLDLTACAARVAAALAAAYRGEIETDRLHRLIVLSDVDHRQVEVLRAYRRYRQRIGSRYTESYQNDVLAQNAGLCEKQIRLFRLRFDPEIEPDDAAEQALRDEIRADLDAVELLDHDRILRNQLGLIDATVRTTVFRRDRGAIAFKLVSEQVPAMPQPAPMWEIYVYAPDMEGIHLRGGMIARGGIRWSERMDYRTEVFGLMRAQMTKNAVIVPAGAKGGFVLRQLPREAAEARAAVKAAYVRYIEALLDLTDDRDGSDVVPPDGVRVRDEDDSYLVVAADKGTATFSDTANAIAERRGFWLGDAFASGGSSGYDHKALGITAKGAWESVTRHFRAIGMDPQEDAFTAVGIGDMSGDVFGNGMLLSRSLRLVAAYDHRHVFIDPDPDAERGFAERQRLFGLERSSWDDYDRDAISEGGGVFPRTAKSVTLSEQARAALGIEDAQLAPTDLIRALLRAPVDLLWNGGIGTVVKASAESDADAQDRSSDAIRVDAADLRCRVIGEGGNLGLTQRSRVEAAEHGILVNADFIDNSAGVDCSDHEVNLKILLGLAEADGDLDRPARDELLRDVTDDVVAHVLRDSFSQAQILAQEVQVSAQRLWAYEDLMTGLVEDGILDRDVERLPHSEAMADRRRTGQGLVLPELAVLVAYAKRDIAGALLTSPLLEDPDFASDLHGYFPEGVRARFGDRLPEHPLRRELLSTLAANDVVNNLGPTFVSRLATERGAGVPSVVRAYRIAAIATSSDTRWNAIEALDGTLAPELYWELMRGVDDLVENVTRWQLQQSAEGTIEELGEAGRAGFDDLWRVMPSLRSEEWREQAESDAQALMSRGAPEDLARAHAMQGALVHAPDVIAAAHTTGRSVADVASAFFALGDRLRLEWLERAVGELPAGGRLQRWAVFALADDLLAVRRQLAELALLEAPQDDDPRDAVDGFLESRAEKLTRLQAFTRALSSEGSADLAGMTLAVRQLRTLAGA